MVTRGSFQASGRGGRGGHGRHGGRGSGAGRPKRPNFFVGFRIRNEEIIERITQLQERIEEAFPETQMCLIDPSTLHVTLCMMFLADDQAIQQAVEIVEAHSDIIATLARADDPPEFDFRGLNFFGNNFILHSPMDVSSALGVRLGNIAETLHNAFAAVGVSVGETFRRPYCPHITIWKTTKFRHEIAQLDKMRDPSDKVADALCKFLKEGEEPLASAHYGMERPTTVELLSMREKEPDGYYKVYASKSLLTPSPAF